MAEEDDGFSVAATRQNAGSALNGGPPRPPLYPRPRPAVLAVTLPGTAGTGPSVPARAEDPPPPRVAGFWGAAKAPALTTWTNVIVVFGRATDANRSQAAGDCAFCAMAALGKRSIVRTKLRMKLLSPSAT